MPVEGAGAFGQFQRPKSWCTHIKLILLNRHNKLCVGQKENNLCRSLTYPTNQAKRSNFIDDRSSKLTNHNLLALRHYGKTTDKSVSFHQPNWYPFIFIFTWEVVKTSLNNACPFEAPICNKLSRSECKPTHKCLFHSFYHRWTYCSHKLVHSSRHSYKNW